MLFWNTARVYDFFAYIIWWYFMLSSKSEVRRLSEYLSDARLRQSHGEFYAANRILISTYIIGLLLNRKRKKEDFTLKIECSLQLLRQISRIQWNWCIDKWVVPSWPHNCDWSPPPPRWHTGAGVTQPSTSRFTRDNRTMCSHNIPIHTLTRPTELFTFKCLNIWINYKIM